MGLEFGEWLRSDHKPNTTDVGPCHDTHLKC